MTYGTTGIASPDTVYLLEDQAGPSDSCAHNTRWRPAGKLLTAVVMTGMLLTALVAIGHQHTNRAQSISAPARVHHTPNLATLDLDFAARNEYSGTSGEATAHTWLEGVLVEPHRTTSFQVVSAWSGTAYNWTITAKSGKEYHYEGVAVLHTFTEVGLYSIELVASTASDDGSRTHQALQKTLACKYVRREIRSLLPTERQELLSAMSVLWKVEKDRGVKIYGDDYLDIWSINRLHYRAASDQTCDHFHDGMAFLVAHSALTLIFEQSLRLVNPKLSVPYWDFTIEGTTINLDYDGDFNRLREATPLFTNEYFGGADPNDLMVKDGLWGYTTIPRVADDDRSKPNVYGLLRSPWDVDGRPFLTRGLGRVCSERFVYYKWPTCQIHYELNTQKISFYDWNWEALYTPHGTVHIWIGGLNECQDSFDELAKITGDRIADDLRPLAFLHRKSIYRQQYWRCEGSANATSTAKEIMESGVCGCLDYDLSNDEHVQILLNTIPYYLGVMTGKLSKEQKRAVARVLCTGVQSTGDQLQSSSPLDPSFWPTHPAMERLFQKAQLSGVMTDISWPNQHSWTGADGTTYEVLLNMWGSDCVGHSASDVFPYGLVDANEMSVKFDLVEEGALVSRRNMTNLELLKALSPRSNSLPYVYDNMDWTHCLQEGIDFSKMGPAASKSAQDSYHIFKAGENPLDRYYDRMAQMMSRSK